MVDENIYQGRELLPFWLIGKILHQLWEEVRLTIKLIKGN